VLVHGTGVNSAFWGDIPTDLSRSHRVVVYDRRGFGQSTGSVVRDYRVHTRDLLALLEEYAAEPATLVGWSAGGIVTLDAALARPELVRSLVLYEPPWHAKRYPSPGLLTAMMRVQFRRRLLRDPVGAARVFLRFVFNEGSHSNAMDRFSAGLRAEIDHDAQAALAEIDAGTGEYLTAAAIRSLAVPVMGVTGERTSPMLRSSMRRLAAHLPSMTIRKLGGGHALHLDDPAGFTKTIASAVQLHF